MTTFFHVTNHEAWNTIRKEQGFKGGDGVCGFGVYLWDDVDSALEFVENIGAPQPVVLEVKSDDPISCEEALGGFPEGEADQAFYEHVFLVPLADKNSFWHPKRIKKLKIT